MSRKKSLRTKLTWTISLAVLITVVIATLLSNLLISRQFVSYVAGQQKERTNELISSLNRQYSSENGIWNVDFIHMLGMYALYDGYIIHVFDADGASLWDAQSHDMSTCAQIMEDIERRMARKYPAASGSFISETYPLTQSGVQTGAVQISYYGPFFLSENDFNFLRTLNIIFAGTGAAALLAAFLIGGYLAQRLSRPIVSAAVSSRKMAGGDYTAKIAETADTDELNQLISSFNFLSSTLAKQESFRKQLTADVAHELRTPLHTVGIHLESMIEGVWEPTAERLQSCHEEIQRIYALVKDLENLAGMESDAPNLRIEPVAYDELIRKCLGSLEIEMRNKSLTVQAELAAITIQADRAKWYQLVHNLLTNAIKYTPEGGKITLTLKKTQQMYELTVSDTGPGIAEKDMPFIFERFYRCDQSRSRASGGSGIGLAIVKSIASAHGGAVSVQSSPDKGTRFTVLLPILNRKKQQPLLLFQRGCCF